MSSQHTAVGADPTLRSHDIDRSGVAKDSERRGPIDVLILGQAYWSSYLADRLNRHAHDLRVSYVPPTRYAMLIARRPAPGPRVIVRAGYRIGGTTWRARAFDAYWSLLMRAMPDAGRCHYWLGTDVLHTMNEATAGTLRQDAIRSARSDLHLATAPWLVEELRTVGVNAAVALIPGAGEKFPGTVLPFPDRFSVMTYLPRDRFEFYGGNIILEAARRLPMVRFDVVGSGEDPTSSATANVHWHGWVDDLAPYYAGAVAVIRLAEHDAIGGTVMEGLLHARHVLFTYEIPHVLAVRPLSADALVEKLRFLFDAHRDGALELNTAGREYALAEFDESKLIDHLATLIRARA